MLRAERGLSRQELAAAIGYLERGDYTASLELAFRGEECRSERTPIGSTALRVATPEQTKVLAPRRK